MCRIAEAETHKSDKYPAGNAQEINTALKNLAPSIKNITSAFRHAEGAEARTVYTFLRWGMFLASSGFVIMTPEDVASAKRLALGAVLLYVLWSLANAVFSFGGMLSRQHQEQQETMRTLEQSRERQTTLLRQQTETLARQRAQTVKPHTAGPRTTTSRSAREKLAASALVNRLRQVNAFGLVANPERRLHCIENRGGWDYTCLFHPDPITNATWVQFGVLVDDKHVIEMSEMYPSDTHLQQPLTHPRKSTSQHRGPRACRDGMPAAIVIGCSDGHGARTILK
jgi:hypothetical protein